MPIDWLRMLTVNMGNQYRWNKDKNLRAWVEQSRLDGFTALAHSVTEEDTEKVAVMERFGQSAGAALANAQKLLAQA